MANSITGFNTFSAGTLIRSSQVNSNFSSLLTSSEIWNKYTIPYTSYSALGATTTGGVSAFTLDASEIISAFYIKHSTAFSGGAITAAKVKVGIASSTNKYVDEFDVVPAVSSTNFSLSSTLGIENSSTSILLTMSLTGGNLSALVAGSIDLYVKKSTLPT